MYAEKEEGISSSTQEDPGYCGAALRRIAVHARPIFGRQPADAALANQMGMVG
jgi:hypothetical protein